MTSLLGVAGERNVGVNQHRAEISALIFYITFMWGFFNFVKYDLFESLCTHIDLHFQISTGEITKTKHVFETRRVTILKVL